MEQQKGQSAHIVENFHLQRGTDAHHKDKNCPVAALILPTKQFFWHVESRGLFECMIARHEYWLKDKSEAILVENLNDMAETTGNATKDHKELLVAVLGIGNGTKETRFYDRIKAWRAKQIRNSKTTLLFIDINYQMIVRAAREVKGNPSLRFCNADFDNLVVKHIACGEDPEKKVPTLFLLLGNTFANQIEKVLLERLRGLGDPMWLLFDAPLGKHSTWKDKAGYGTDAAKEFKELTLRHFDKRYERKWRMRQSNRVVPKVAGNQISSVPGARTLSNVAQSPTFGELWMGMSHRYDASKLDEFLITEGWSILRHWPRHGHGDCRYYLTQPNGNSTPPSVTS